MNNLTGTFRTLRNSFPNAKLAYSEMLYVGHEESNPEINRCIKSINEQMVDFCNNNEMIFIRHASLQTGGDNLYDDDVHISRAGGTALFVSDVHRAIGLQRGNVNRARVGGNDQRSFRNQREQFRMTGSNQLDPNTRPGRGNMGGFQHEPMDTSININQLYNMMLLTMMKNFQE